MSRIQFGRAICAAAALAALALAAPAGAADYADQVRAMPHEVGNKVRNVPYDVTPRASWLRSPSGRPFGKAKPRRRSRRARVAGPSDPRWIDGTIAYQSGTNCVILGGSYPEQMVGAFTGYWGTEDISYPKIGDRYWGHIYMTVVGNTCPYGIADVATEIALPAGTSLAIDPSSSDPNDKVRCYGTNTSGQTSEVTDTYWNAPWNTSITGKYCDSTATSQGLNGGIYLGQRLLAQGQSFHLVFPLRSTRKLNGIAEPNNASRMTGILTSGVNTTAQPYQWVFVGDRPVQIEYPTDSVTGITDTTAHTKGHLFNWYRGGRVYVDLGPGTSGAYSVTAGPYDIPSSGTAFAVDQDWMGLAPGTDYSWRLRFVDMKGTTTTADDVTYNGANQTFRTTGTPGAGGGGTPTPGTGGSGSPSTGGSGSQQQQQQTTNQGQTDTTGTPQVTPGDSTPPGLQVAVSRGKLGKALKKGLRARITCDEACSASGQIQLDRKTAKKRRLGKGKKPAVVGRGSGAVTAPGTVRMTLKFTRKSKRRLKRSRSLKVTVIVVARDNAGNVTSGVRRVVRLKR